MCERAHSLSAWIAAASTVPAAGPLPPPAFCCGVRIRARLGVAGGFGGAPFFDAL
jgi:hypothetical protein